MESVKVTNMKVVHFHVLLDSMEKDLGTWMREQKIERLKEGILIKWSKVTICNLA